MSSQPSTRRRFVIFDCHSSRTFVLRQAGLYEACAFSRGNTCLRIALIDGAVNSAHPVFAGSRITLTDGSGSFAADDHATFGASILLASETARKSGLAMGLCPACTLISFPVASAAMLDGSMPLVETARMLARAVGRAMQAQCRIILFGVAIRHVGHADWSALRDALRTAAAADILTVIPSGNRLDLADGIQSPWGEVLTVASSNWRGTASRFSPSIGPKQGLIFAPGENIPGASGKSDLVLRSGTSGAAAIAAGAVALGCSVPPGRSPFDVARAMFPPPHKVLNGSIYLGRAASNALEMELPHGSGYR